MLQWARSADNFAAPLSGQWVRRNGLTNPLTSGGMVTTNTSSGLYPAEFIARRTSTADQYVAVTLAQLHPGTSGGSASCLFLRSPNNAASGTVPVAFIKNAQIGIFTMTSWAAGGLAPRAPYADVNGGANIPLGSRIEFYVINNVYYVACNGVVVINPWVDSANIASQTGRYGGLIMQYASDGSASGAMGFDDFVFGDYRPVEVPTPMQSMNRSASF
ncbi:hypothetical protein [Nocardia australiensis]|uniref:hypothetical protein n=1 Tax=Nocardia australiensis TaxID=2887191 RepID=UPI001D14BF27|nr:hypothetical protein [Nocardia australiensis]